jgi:hypothetical protein
MKILLLGLYCLIFFSQTVLALEKPTQARIAGNIVFLLGKAQVFDKNNIEKELVLGDAITVGSTIVTSDRAQIGMRMIDGAVQQIKANSTFQIIRYDYDPQLPQESVIKVFLKQGQLHSKTGAAGKAAKHNYRLNTPIAAIGIRGTEFTVYADAQQTRVDVLSGGVVMSPFSNGCALSGSGPCGGRNAIELFANHRRDASLILQRNQERPKIVIPTKKTASNNNLPLPVANTDKSVATPAITNTSSTTTAVNTDTASSEKSAASPKAARSNDTASTPLAQAKPAPSSTTSSIKSVKWGRWDPKLSNNQLAEGYELVAKNADYAIIRRADENFVLPNTGVYQFSPTRHEAYVRDVSQDSYTQADINNAYLSVDFVNRNFDTGFDLVADNVNTHIQTSGNLSEDGILSTTKDQGNTRISGAIAGDTAKEASYAFYHQIDDNLNVAGAIDWDARD